MHKTLQQITRIFSTLFCFVVTAVAGQLTLEPMETSITGALEIYTVDRQESDLSNIYHIVRTNDELLFCDSNLTVISDRRIVPNGKTKIYPSKLNRYFLLEEFVSLAERKFEVGLRRHTLIDYENNQYYVKEHPLEYDYFTTKKTVISDMDGTLYELETSTAEFIIRSRNGDELKRIKLYEDFKYWYSGLNGFIDISADGSTVVVNMNRTNFVPERQTKPRIPLRGKDAGKEIPGRFIKGQSGEPHLFIFNKMGDLLSKQKLSHETAMGVGITMKAEYIFASVKTGHPYREINETVTTIFDITVNPLYTYSFRFGNFHLLNDLLIVGVRTLKRPLIAINLSNGEIRWRIPLRKYVKIINIDDSNNIVIVADDGMSKPPSLTEYNLIKINQNNGVILDSTKLGFMPDGAYNIGSLKYIPLTKKSKIYKSNIETKKLY